MTVNDLLLHYYSDEKTFVTITATNTMEKLNAFEECNSVLLPDAWKNAKVTSWSITISEYSYVLNITVTKEV